MATPAPEPPTKRPMSQFRLRYKDRHLLNDVVIEARNLEFADRVGHAYCDQREKKFTFIKVEPVVVATEEILG